MERSIIFCYSPGKIPLTLCCYEDELKKNREVTIICPMIVLTRFFMELNLRAKIILNNDYERVEGEPIEHVKKNIEKLEIKPIDDIHVFFTDWATGILMGLYLKELRTYPQCLIHSEFSRNYLAAQGGKYLIRKDISFRQRLRELKMWLKYGYRFKYSKGEGTYLLCIDVDYYKYKEIDFDDSKVNSKYKRSLRYNGEKTAIIMTEPYRFNYQTKEDYDRLNREIVENLHKRGYKVGMKGHPRIGGHPDVETMCDFVVPNYIPTEFLDFRTVDLVIGFVSTSICHAVNETKAYSVLPMCEIIDEAQAKYQYDYVDKMGHGKVILINSFDEIDE